MKIKRLIVDSLNKYYIETLKKIDELLDNKHYEEAFELISQEINSPYIPNEFIEKFEKLHLEVKKNIAVQQIQLQYNNMGKLQMLGKIYDGKKLNLDLLSFFIVKFQKQIDKIDLQYLNKIFQDKNVNNNEKIFILEQLKLSEINYTFDCINNNFNEIFTINSNANFEFNNHSYFQAVYKEIRNLLFKNPSQLIMCNELLHIIYDYYFGVKQPFDVKYLAQSIVDYVENNFNNSQSKDDKFKQWLDNIMSGKK